LRGDNDAEKYLKYLTTQNQLNAIIFLKYTKVHNTSVKYYLVGCVDDWIVSGKAGKFVSPVKIDSVDVEEKPILKAKLYGK
jgi:hypothetical protein